MVTGKYNNSETPLKLLSLIFFMTVESQRGCVGSWFPRFLGGVVEILV